MDETPQISVPQVEAVEANLDQKSDQFVGRWNRLISTSNWEKGRIICQWREALVEAGAAHTEYSDDTWSRLVDGVSGQHTGRLRRVYSRFGHVATQYDGLFWSHFQAALDWDDAEMWLEGAVQNGWSVSRMRRTRWEATGAVADQEPSEDVVESDLDEDFVERADEASAELGGNGALGGGRSSSDTEDDQDDELDDDEDSIASADDQDSANPVQLVRPFADLPDLPADLADAFDTFKLAILRHKTEGWEQITPDAVVRCLDSLKQLVTAPSSEDSPF